MVNQISFYFAQDGLITFEDFKRMILLGGAAPDDDNNIESFLVP